MYDLLYAMSLICNIVPGVDQQSTGITGGTVLTALSMKMVDTDVISITTNSTTSASGQSGRLLVYRGRELLDFSDPNMYWQEYPGMLTLTEKIMSRFYISSLSRLQRHTDSSNVVR